MNRRQRKKVNNYGYGDAGASFTRRALKGFLAASSSTAWDIDFNNRTLRQRARMLYMAAPVATAAIDTNRTKIVGQGLMLESKIDRETLRMSPEAARAWERRTEAEFALWAESKNSCDALGLNTFNELQQLALKSWLISGDVFALVKRYEPTKLKPYSLRLHLIEADRVSTPNTGNFILSLTEGVIPEGEPGEGHKVHDGVEVDDNGMVVAYHICNSYPFEPGSENAEWVRVLAYGAESEMPNIFHVMDSERPDQYRGVPYLAKVIEPLLQMRRYTESELMAALVQSFFTAWIETEDSPSEFPLAETEEDATEEDDEREYEMGPGNVLTLKKGEKVQFGNPNVPSSGFESFIKTLCRLIGAALEIPYDILVKEFDSSYSASRGALLEAWEAFKMRRKWFVDDLCQPVYELWLSEAVARGRIKAPGFFEDPLIRKAYCGARWTGTVQGQLDPKKEVQAAVLMRDNAFKTNEQIAREFGGGDWLDNVDQVALENEKLAEAQRFIHPSEFAETTGGEGRENETD